MRYLLLLLVARDACGRLAQPIDTEATETPTALVAVSDTSANPTAVSFLEYLSDHSVDTSLACSIMTFSLTGIASFAIVQFAVANRWFFFTNAFPFEVSEIELANHRYGSIAFAMTTLASMASATCVLPQLDGCEKRRLLGTYIVFPGFLLITWGMVSSAASFEEERRVAFNREHGSADVGSVARTTPGYAWRLNSLAQQQETRAAGNMDLAKTQADLVAEVKSDRAAYDVLEHASRKSHAVEFRTKPHANFKTTLKMFFSNSLSTLGAIFVGIGLLVASSACGGVTGLSTSSAHTLVQSGQF